METQDPCSDIFRVKLIMLQHIKMYIFTLLHCLIFVEGVFGPASLIVLVLINSFSFLRTSLVNPGVVRKKTQHKYLPDVVRFGSDVLVQIVVNKNGDWLRRIRIGNEEYEEKYCTECNIFRVAGVAHCRECNACIIEMDHHCVWFGNCIARNNIRQFHIYLYTLLTVILTNIIFLYKILTVCLCRRTGTARVLRCCIFTVIIMYISFFGLILTFTAFNIYIALYSSRSRDFIKGRMKDKTFDIRKACKNLSTIRPDISFEEISV